MGRYERRNRAIIVLAYVHRYVMPIACIMLPMLLAQTKQSSLLGTGIGCVGMALYDLIGYRLRRKHIYCSYQNAYHQPMTPNRIVWSNIRKTDAYGIPLFFGLLGTAMILSVLFAEF